MKQKILDYLRNTVHSDGMFVWGNDRKDGDFMVIDMRMRGWGKIQYMFKSEDEAGQFQDAVGDFISEAINEKVARDWQSNG
jgi:hypothetical protein